MFYRVLNQIGSIHIQFFGIPSILSPLIDSSLGIITFDTLPSFAAAMLIVELPQIKFLAFEKISTISAGERF